MPVLFHDFAPPADDFRQAVLAGLAQTPKRLPSRFIYDERGSHLFEAILEEPEYYVPRVEIALLRARGVEPHIIEYLKTPPTAAELRAIVRRLGISAADLVRTGEDIYKATYAGKILTDAQWVDALVKNPILIERPIVVRGTRAVIGRPPENVLELLQA